MIAKVLKTLLVSLVGMLVLAAIGLYFVNTEAGREWIAGHASLYAGQAVRIDGPVSVHLSPPGISVVDLHVAVPGADVDSTEGRWLSAGRVELTLPGLSLPPSAGAPLLVVARDGRLNMRAYQAARDDDTGGSIHIPLAPFALSARVQDFTVVPLAENLPDLRLHTAELSFDPASGATLDSHAVLGEKSIDARVDIGLADEATAESVPVDVDGVLNVAGLFIAVRGAIADLRTLEGLDVALTAGGDIAQSTGMSTAFQEQEVTGRLTGDFGSLVFDMERLEARTENGRLALSGRMFQQRQRVVVERGRIDVEATDLSAFLGEFGVDTKLAMPASFRASFDGDYDGADIRSMVLELDDSQVSLRGSGRVSLDDDGEARIESGELSLEAADIATLVTAFGARSSPVRGRLAASASLAGTLSELAVSGMHAELAGAAITATAGGIVSLVDGATSFELAVDASASDIAAAIVDVPMPEWFGSTGRASGTLSYGDKRYSLTGLTGVFRGARGEARLTGDIENLADLSTPAVDIELDAGDARGDGVRQLAVHAALPGGIDEPGTLSIDGRLARGAISFEGEVASPRERRGIGGVFRFEADPDVIKGAGPGVDGAAVLAGRIDIGDLDAREFVVNAAIEGTDGTVKYEGSLDDSFAGGGTLKIESMDLNVLAALAGVTTDFPNVGRLQGEVVHDAGSLTIKSIDFHTGASSVNGAIRLVWPTPERAATLVTINARSPDLYLADLGLENKEPDQAYYFSRNPLPLKSLRNVDLDVTLNVDRVHTKALDYHSVELVGRSRDGMLRLSSAQQLLGGGDSTMSTRIDARPDIPVVAFKLTLNGIDPGELSVVKEGEGKFSGDIDAELDIRGAGDSVGTILGNANGHFLVRINHAVLPNRKLNLLSADFLFETLRTVNPFIRQSEELDVECGVMGFVVRDGTAVADKTVVIKGKRLLIVGEGEIDLGSEKVAMVIRPKAQDGIGLNTSGLVKFIGIGGTLAEPEIRTDPKGLLMTGASIGAAVASGGMSLFLQNIFDRLTTGKGECERVEAAFRDRLAGNPVTRRAPESGRTGG